GAGPPSGCCRWTTGTGCCCCTASTRPGRTSRTGSPSGAGWSRASRRSPRRSASWPRRSGWPSTPARWSGRWAGPRSSSSSTRSATSRSRPTTRSGWTRPSRSASPARTRSSTPRSTPGPGSRPPTWPGPATRSTRTTWPTCWPGPPAAADSLAEDAELVALGVGQHVPEVLFVGAAEQAGPGVQEPLGLAQHVPVHPVLHRLRLRHPGEHHREGQAAALDPAPLLGSVARGPVVLDLDPELPGPPAGDRARFGGVDAELVDPVVGELARLPDEAAELVALRVGHDRPAVAVVQHPGTAVHQLG